MQPNRSFAMHRRAWLLFVCLSLQFCVLWQKPENAHELVLRVMAQNPTVLLPSASIYTYFSFDFVNTATTPYPATSTRTTTGNVNNANNVALTEGTTVIPCQPPFAQGLDANSPTTTRPKLLHTAATTVTGSNVAMWVFLQDYDWPNVPQAFFGRDCTANTAVNSFDLQMGMFGFTTVNGVNQYNQFCVGQGVTTVANQGNAAISACIAVNSVPLQKWTHVGIKLTRNASAYPRIYINGALVTNVIATGAFVSGPSFTSATAQGFSVGRSTFAAFGADGAPLRGLIRGLITSAGVFTDADFTYLGSTSNQVQSSTGCDAQSYCAAKGNTAQRCYALRTQCDWDPNSSICNAGAPVTCADFDQDTVGCAARSDCTVQTYNNNQCAKACSQLTAQECVGSTPIRQDCRLNYNTMTCFASTAYVDGCSNQVSQSGCTGGGCYFDPYLQNCFVSQTQFKTVFPCSYFSQRQDTACSDESCVLLSDNSCIVAVTTSNTQDNSTSINYARKIFFLNPRVLPNTQTFQLTIGVPFATSATPRDAWPFNPSWPIFQILFPVTGIGAYAKAVNPFCSSQSDARSSPVALSQFSVPDVPALQNYILQWIRTYKNLTFADAVSLGSQSNAVYGKPLIGPSQLITQVQQTGNETMLYFTLQRDLVTLVSQCSQFGATAQVNPTNKVYTIPISYVEQNPQNAFTQFTILYTITITNSGTVTVGTSTNYHEEAFPLQVVFPTSSCPLNQARMQISWQLELHDVFDSSRIIGPRSLSDVSIRSPASPAGPNNCFQDKIVNFQNLGCNYLSYTCTFVITTESNCRALTDDGNAFNLCKYAQDVDRLADLGGNFTYAQALDGYHEFYVNNYNCPINRINDAACALVTSSQFNLPDQIKASIITAQYLENKVSFNPFSVQAGFLPTPIASLGSASLVTPAQGEQFGLLRYEGNLFSSQPLTVVIQLPTQSVNDYDLRLVIDYNNVTFTPLDQNGVPLFNSTIVRNFASFRSSLLYTSKADFANGCGSDGSCKLLPACINIKGCDGFSIGSVQLKALVPANGYRFALSYRVDLSQIGPASASLNAGSLQQPVAGSQAFVVSNSSVNAPMARRLLQLQQQQSMSPLGAGQLNTAGQIFYDVIFGDDSLLQKQEEARLRAICLATSFEELRAKYSRDEQLPRFWSAALWSLLTVALPSCLLYTTLAFLTIQLAVSRKLHAAFD